MKSTDKTTFPSRGFAASVPGAGHIRYGTPCQDASGVILAPRPAAIVCDGRGSAKLSHFGAQAAVKSFFSQLNILEPFVAGVLDRDAPPEKWDGICRLFYRALLQVKLDLASERGGEEKDFDFTVAYAVAGKVSIGCFQVGDGAIVLRQDGECRTAFVPDKGEFANQTQFLRPGGEDAGKFHAAIFPAAGNAGIAITSDGPEHLMFRQADMTPGPIFGQLFDDLVADELCEQDLRDYLTRKVWSDDPRGNDDRSLAVLLPSAFSSNQNAAPGLAESRLGKQAQRPGQRPALPCRPEMQREERCSDDISSPQDIAFDAPGEKDDATEDVPEEEFDPAKVIDVIRPTPTWRPIPSGHFLCRFATALLLLALGFLLGVIVFASRWNVKGEPSPTAVEPEAVQPLSVTNVVEAIPALHQDDPGTELPNVEFPVNAVTNEVDVELLSQ